MREREGKEEVFCHLEESFNYFFDLRILSVSLKLVVVLGKQIVQGLTVSCHGKNGL